MSILSDNISIQPTLGDILIDVQSTIQIRPMRILDESVQNIFIEDSQQLKKFLEECIRTASSLVAIDSKFIRELLLMILKDYFNGEMTLRNIRVQKLRRTYHMGENLKYMFDVTIVHEHAKRLFERFFDIPPKYSTPDIKINPRFRHRDVECIFPHFIITMTTSMVAPNKMLF